MQVCMAQIQGLGSKLKTGVGDQAVGLPLGTGDGASRRWAANAWSPR